MKPNLKSPDPRLGSDYQQAFDSRRENMKENIWGRFLDEFEGGVGWNGLVVNWLGNGSEDFEDKLELNRGILARIEWNFDPDSLAVLNVLFLILEAK